MVEHPRGGPLYKILPTAQWNAAQQHVPWAPIDRSDGFVHMSAAHQVRQTAAKHFAGDGDLTLLEIDPRRSATSIRWEVSRGGDHFPHVYGDIEREAVVGVDALPFDSGVHRFPSHVPVPVPRGALPDALAHRLERAEAAALVALARSAARVLADQTPASVTVGSAVATRFSTTSPINALKGWGLDAVTVPAALEAAELLFRQADAAFAVEVFSHAPPEVLKILADRNYRALATENVLVHSLQSVAIPQAQVQLRPVSEADAQAWGLLLARGFSGQTPPPPELTVFGPLSLACGQTRAYTIVADGVDVGACSLRFDHEVAMLTGSSVLAEFRGRGYHQAAIVERLNQARLAGCLYAKFDVAPGSTSHRNAHRAGFVLSHTRTAFGR